MIKSLFSIEIYGNSRLRELNGIRMDHIPPDDHLLVVRFDSEGGMAGRMALGVDGTDPGDRFAAGNKGLPFSMGQVRGRDFTGRFEKPLGLLRCIFGVFLGQPKIALGLGYENVRIRVDRLACRVIQAADRDLAKVRLSGGEFGRRSRTLPTISMERPDLDA